LSRSRDVMKVARQFIAWYRCEKGNRPGGYGMIGSDRRATLRTINQPGVGIRPCPTGRIPVWTPFQAINCLATIISPFLLRHPELWRTGRDNKPAALSTFEATSLHRYTFEHEHERQTPNAERRTPNAKRQTPCERRMKGVVLDRHESYQ
jgi:hypothetical protein